MDIMLSGLGREMVTPVKRVMVASSGEGCLGGGVVVMWRIRWHYAVGLRARDGYSG